MKGRRPQNALPSWITLLEREDTGILLSENWVRQKQCSDIHLITMTVAGACFTIHPYDTHSRLKP